MMAQILQKLELSQIFFKKLKIPQNLKVDINFY